MALTDVITDELLKTLETDTDPQTILARYRGSKGPLYAALARATAEATTRLQTAVADAQAAEARRDADDQARVAVTRETAAARRSLQAVTRQHAALTQTLDAQHARLAALQALQDAGWEGESLAALAHVFHATDPAHRPAWRAFIQLAQAARDTQDLAVRVQTEAERARRAEAAVATRRTEAHVTAEAITLARWWVDHHLTAPWVRSIQRLAAQLDGDAAGLADRVTAALTQYGTLEAACTALDQRRQTAAIRVQELAAQGTALQAERDQIQAALAAVAVDGSQRIAAAETQATTAIDQLAADVATRLRTWDAALAATLDRLATLQAEAVHLEDAVRWAQALTDPDASAWDGVSPHAWLALFAAWQQWLARRAVDWDVTFPADMATILGKQAQFPTLYGPPRLPATGLSRCLAGSLAQVAVTGAPTHDATPAATTEGTRHA